ncbi:hypothetical protein CR203_03525 [Salipaludibacillus neizhouensis]|uniref:Uncharacterized protein n=1 Tax=Salipaludibacillus neizhouensis TaxID=885475 RepID=A0A3A9KBW1_9BACI|nr:YheC/YheD family protein [Salipaludibacillus neizhouensis]RKL69118.1 hypothetical protein CR203_03525 [Salipaludibacillus neizhouensis]
MNRKCKLDKHKLLIKNKNLAPHFPESVKVNKKPIDFRYIVQRRGTKTKWVITGTYGEIARAGFIITNLKKGARVVTVREAL